MESLSTVQTSLQDGGLTHSGQSAQPIDQDLIMDQSESTLNRSECTLDRCESTLKQSENIQSASSDRMVIDLDDETHTNSQDGVITAVSPPDDDVVVIGRDDPVVRHVRCPLCQESFSVTQDNTFQLIVHLHEHVPFGIKANGTGNRTKFSYQNGEYHCSACGLGTKLRFVFREHMRHHILRFPYYCNVCKDVLRDVPDFLQHSKDKHNGVLLELKVCVARMLDSVMDKLGPQAPPTDDVVAVQHETPRLRNVGGITGTASEPIQIRDEDDMKDLIQESDPPPQDGTDSMNTEDSFVLNHTANMASTPDDPGNDDPDMDAPVPFTIDLTSPISTKAYDAIDSNNASHYNTTDEATPNSPGAEVPIENPTTPTPPVEMGASRGDQLDATQQSLPNDEMELNDEGGSENPDDYSNENESIITYQNTSTENVLPTDETAKNDEQNDHRIQTTNAGHYTVINDLFKCVTCKFLSKSPQHFRLHVYRHIHGSTGCSHAPSSVKAKYWHCKILNGVMTLLAAKISVQPSNAGSQNSNQVEELLDQEVGSEPQSELGGSLNSASGTSQPDGIDQPEATDQPKDTNLSEEVEAVQQPSDMSPATEDVAQSEDEGHQIKQTAPSTTNFQSSDSSPWFPTVDQTQPTQSVPADADQKPVMFRNPESSSYPMDNDLVQQVIPSQEDDFVCITDDDDDDATMDNMTQDSKVNEPVVEETCSRLRVYENSRTRKGLEQVMEHLRVQKETHTSQELPKLYRCGMESCDFQIADEDSFLIHLLLRHASIGTLPCAFCSTTYVDAEELAAHVTAIHVSTMNSGSDSGQFQCSSEGCCEVFNQVGELHTHLLSSHADDSNYSCSFCSRSFTGVNDLVVHINGHISKVMKCPYCGQNFSLKKEILEHLREKHPTDPKKINMSFRIVPCSMQSKPSLVTNVPFDKEKDENHSLSHHSLEDKSSCPINNPKDQSSVTSDVNTILPATCPEADDSETIESDDIPARSPDIRLDGCLVQMPLQCRECNYRCNALKTMSVHEAIHKNRRPTPHPYLCPVCPYSVNSRHVFQNHMQHHEGEHSIRYYICMHCHWNTNKMSLIEDHILAKHPREPFKFEVQQVTVAYMEGMCLCPFCRGSYIWRSEFIRHIQKMHSAETSFYQHICGIPDKDLDMVRKVCAQYASSRQRILGPDYATMNYEALAVGEVQQASQVSDKHNVQIYRLHCDFCSFSTNEQKLYIDHIKTHSGTGAEDRSALESDTSSSLSEMSNTDNHQDATPHLGIKILRCSICPYTTTSYKNLANHKTTHTKNANIQEGYACPYCKYKGSNIKGATYHIHRYHPTRTGSAIRITGGKLLKEREMVDDAPVKRVAKKSTRQGLVTSRRSSGDPVVYQQMGSWTTNYKSPYATTSVPQQTITPQEVPALPKSLTSATLAEFERSLPTEMIFKSPVKCPKCNFSNKVRYNLIRHIKSHATEASNGESPRQNEGARSPASSLSTQMAASMADDDEDVDDDDDDDDDDDSMNECMENSLDESAYAQFCTKVPCMDLYRCNSCVFMHANPAKVAQHFENKHKIKCQHCDYEAVNRDALKDHLNHHHDQGQVSTRSCGTNDRSSEEVMDGVTIEDCTGGNYEQERSMMEANAEKYMDKCSTNILRCNICGYEQEGTSALRRHIWAVHIKYYPYACKYCDVAMVEINKLKRHLSRKHPDMPPVIVKRSNVTAAESFHIKSEPGTNPETSKKSSMGSDASLPVLIKQEPLDAVASELDRSDQSFPTLESEATHVASFSTSFEDDSIQKSSTPKKSIPVKRGTKFHKCAYCSYISRWSAIDTKRHVFSQHLRRREYTCRYCNFEGNKPGSVRSHLARAHPHMSGGIKHRRGEMECVKPIDENGETAVYSVVTDEDVPILEEESLLDEDIRSKLSIFKGGEPKPGQPMPVPNAERAVPTEREKKKDEARKLRYSVETPKTSKKEQEETVNPSESVSSGRRHDIIWRCKLCGLLGNKIKVKMHVLARHMKLKPLRCPYCCMYIWKKDAIRRHVMIEHPDKEVAFVNVLTENLEYICRHIESISGAPESSSGNWKKGPENKKGIDMMFTSIRANNYGPTNSKDANTASTSGQKKNMELWRCKLCGLVDSRVRHRYHVAVHHLKLHPIQCPCCMENFWKWDIAKKHVETEHAGMDITLINVLSNHIGDIEKNIERVDSSLSVDIVKAMEESTGAQCSNVHATPKLKSSKDIMMRCKLCGIQGNRAKLRYHLICHHLKLKPVRCGHCTQHFYKNHLAMRHMAREHRGLPKFVRHITTEKAQYLETQMEVVEIPQTKSFSHLVSEKASTTPKEIEELPEDLMVNDEGRSGLEDFKPRLEGNEYKCDKCLYRTSVLVALKAHHKLHQMFQCCYCSFKATLASKVQTHCLARHKGKAVKYQPLDMVSKPNSEKPSGINMPVDDAMDESDITPQDLFSSMNVRQKKAYFGNQNKKGGPFRCGYCSSICLYRENMKRHIRSRHNDMPYNFRELNANEKKLVGPCGKSLPSNRHGVTQRKKCQDEFDEDTMETVRNTNEYRCNICNYKTNDVAPTNMKHHVMVHFNYRPYKCIYCTRFTAVRGYSVKKHCRSAHIGKEELFREEHDKDMEAKVIESFVRIKSGRKTQHSLRKRTMYKCAECGLKQDAKRDIIRHICRHINYRPCWCALCDYQEPDNGTMKKHFRMKHRGVAIRYNMRKEPVMEKKLWDMLDASTHMFVTSPEKTGSRCTATNVEPTPPSPPDTGAAEIYNTIANVLDDDEEHDKEARVEKHQPKKSSVETARKSTCNYPRSTAEWNRHLKKGTLIFRCPLCDYYHLRKAKVSEHMLLRHGQKRLKCALCHAAYLYPSHISKHFNHKHPGVRVQSIRINEGVTAPALPDIKAEIYQGYGKESTPAPISIDTSKRVSIKRPIVETNFSPNSKKQRTSWVKEEASPVRSETPGTESDGSSTQVFFEGQPFDIPLEADAEGYFHCRLCKYSTANKEHYKMHAVSHNPPRWQCGYCDKKYVMQFRVRRHCVARHSTEPIVMVDLTSRERFFYSRQDRCRAGSLQSLHSPSTSETSSLDAASAYPASSSSSNNMGIKYCCHLCSFVTYQESELSQHIRLDHFRPKQEPVSHDPDIDWGYDAEDDEGNDVYSAFNDPKLERKAVVMVTDIGPLLAAQAGHASLKSFAIV